MITQKQETNIHHRNWAQNSKQQQQMSLIQQITAASTGALLTTFIGKYIIYIY
jgi:hypothetical protein